MQTMQQVRIHGVDDVRLDDVAVPVAGDNDVVIRVVTCGICGSDFGYITMGGLTPLRYRCHWVMNCPALSRV